MEGRDFRELHFNNPEKTTTIWGQTQKDWFFKTFAESDATFRILISPTPVVGPDRANKNDNHANKNFKEEGDEIRKFLGSQKNAFVICGDRHWQYHSVDTKTGATEFSCGPSADIHAGGFSQKYRSDMHRYLNVVGGFLSVDVVRENGEPTIIFQHHSPAGKVLNEYKKTARE